MGAIAGVLLLAVCIYFTFYRKKKVEVKLISDASEDLSSQHLHGRLHKSFL